jgi:hypothetical protein
MTLISFRGLHATLTIASRLTATFSPTLNIFVLYFIPTTNTHIPFGSHASRETPTTQGREK